MIAYLNLALNQSFRLFDTGPVWVRVSGGYRSPQGGVVHTIGNAKARVIPVVEEAV